ncbi:MAG TPA: bifunctional methylenetetrahydrofolate dehydrogenase/methenyltetrahydrofolate cyclohydrolase FolD [Thermoanaerobaculales bacterium]|nr:bifunctional methylenetetrahydrofolate dehydrogenase/methenyltetrahydrofolate cyclohydrolase FolD [Thermoanaerobaculales bacterium]HQP44937.1 bifunctional methylenetetrahydrofolate dehydrogenase/methenyltetrahydrofolate cyclohydrolase FolD [Thermoanaerobaculales bacterium]
MVGQEKLLDGSRTAGAIRAEVAAEVVALRAAGVTPRLDVVLAGDDPASRVYVGSKAKACSELGIESHTHELPAEVAQCELEELVDRLNADREVDGILVQLPLPAGVDSHAVLDRIDPARDVDGFHPHNVGLLQQNRPGPVPCTPAGVMELLRREGIEVGGRRAVVVGRSDIVGKPMAMMLLHSHATVSMCHSRTRDLPAVTRQAEILVVAAGRLALIGADHVAEGAVVVDVGVHRVEDRATVERLFPGNAKKMAAFASRGAVLAGDVDFAAVAPVAGRITPVPGGVGPLTIAMLLANTVRAARRRRGI